MDQQRWAKIESLYHAVLEKEPSERSGYLLQACAGNSDLRREVETLLGCADAELKGPTSDAVLSGLRQKDPELHDQVQRLLRAREDTVTIRGGNGGLQLNRNPGVNDLIGPYRLLRVLGEGGMGIVYLAEQERPIQRQVALKLIKPGIASSSAVVRFESERQALAMMEHPNIAHVYDAGATEAGQPYFVMEYVPGPSITAYCDQHKLPNRERLKLFRSVCLAIHHAHQKGVIHQDIKPSNVLVTEQDGAPVPKVIDFGIAKAIEQQQASQTLFTQQGILAGTPEYMSPEQANLDARDVDASSDVYSLGVLLYELLVGALPFDPKELRKKGLAEILRIIREDNPTPLSSRLGALPTAPEIAQLRDTEQGTLRRQLSGELDWITMRAMEKDRRRLYNSAAEFAGDVGRYLNNEPVIASPPSRLYRMKKFVSKNRLMVGGVAAVLVALCLGFATSTFRYVRAERARAAEAAKEAAREREDRKRALELEKTLRQGDLEGALRLSISLTDGTLRQQRDAEGTPQQKFAKLEQGLPNRGTLNFWVSSRGYYSWTELVNEFRADFPAFDLRLNALRARDFLAKVRDANQESPPDVAFIDNYQELGPLLESNTVIMMWGASRFDVRGWWVLFRATQHLDAARAFMRWLSRSPRWKPLQTTTASISLEDVQAAQTISRRAVEDVAQAKFSDLWSITDAAGARFQERGQAGAFTGLDTEPLLTFGNSRLAFVLLAAFGAGDKTYGMAHSAVVLRKGEGGWKVLLLMQNYSLPRLEEILRTFDEMRLREGELPALPKVELLAPPDHARLPRFPERPYLEWAFDARVSTGVSYLIESEFGQPGDEQSWTSSAVTFTPAANGLLYRVAKTRWKTESPFGVGAQPHRWRVWAIDAVGRVSISDWRVIDFTN